MLRDERRATLRRGKQECDDEHHQHGGGPARSPFDTINTTKYGNNGDSHPANHVPLLEFGYSESLGKDTVHLPRSNEPDNESTTEVRCGWPDTDQSNEEGSTKVPRVVDPSGNDGSNGAAPVLKRKKPSSPNESTLLHSLESPRQPSRSNRDRLEALPINIPAKMGLTIPNPSPLSTGSVTSPVKENDVHVHHHRNDRLCRPWFQKRKKPKMKQMHLSFPSSL
jgi:hypothetical protein